MLPGWGGRWGRSLTFLRQNQSHVTPHRVKPLLCYAVVWVLLRASVQPETRQRALVHERPLGRKVPTHLNERRAFVLQTQVAHKFTGSSTEKLSAL